MEEEEEEEDEDDEDKTGSLAGGGGGGADMGAEIGERGKAEVKAEAKGFVMIGADATSEFAAKRAR